LQDHGADTGPPSANHALNGKGERLKEYSAVRQTGQPAVVGHHDSGAELHALQEEVNMNIKTNALMMLTTRAVLAALAGIVI